ncbi:glycosyltransferase [Picosynechococcus sp. NKBG15041c]|uniref:glycosyltransferase family 2 protein n=1 Tax=Picosynechococcus sp. NKBG15041c TaxID=1407650 RepID=UPI000463878F|nr:glycosyltransferase family 2 protein [Picosynechococcus sp. NKBG15041c]
MLLDGPTPKCSVIVVAYLPNEQEIILETLTQILQRLIRPEGGLELILAYNTPHFLPVEAELWDLAAQYPELRLLHVQGSHSKAENLNAALAVVTGEMTCIFDADHWPTGDALARAWAWLRGGNYDVVQGRNIIRNHRKNWLTRWIAVEFDCLYGVSHPARSLLVDTALFGGSNGYWRTGVLQGLEFCDRMLTEDIDATLRGLSHGVRIVHDPEIISYELAPVDLKAFWSQRQRWTQGWLEVALKYQFKLLFWQGLDLGQKACWVIMLLYSSFFHAIAIQIFALTVHHWIWPRDVPQWFLIYNFAVMGLSLLCNHLQATIANGRSIWHREGWFYTLISPFFFVVKILIVIVALDSTYRGQRRWVVTPRHALKAKAKPPTASLSKSR